MRNMLSSLFSFLIGFAPLATTADQEGPYTYTVSNGKSTITGFAESYSGVLAITNQLGGYPVTVIGDNAFQFCNAISSITIPDTVTSIGSRAFQYCNALPSILVPVNVTSIGNAAFSGCNTLRTISVDPSNDSYSSLDGVLFNKSQTTLIQFPAAKSSGHSIPDTVTTIAAYAFEYCGTLRGITIPSSVTSMGDYAFSGCYLLASISVDPDNVSYSSLDGVLFNKSQTTLIQFPAWKAASYTIPDSVTAITPAAFRDCIMLTNVTISVNVTDIGDQAFRGCQYLSDITLPDSTRNIGTSAFEWCVRITSIRIPDSVTNIGASAFSDCESLGNLEIGDAVFQIGDHAFSWCTRLTNVVLGASVTTIGAQAFSGCEGLTSIMIPDSVIAIGNGAFWYCKRLTRIATGNSVTTVGDYAFAYCDNLTEIVTGNSVITIGQFAFAICPGLTNVMIGSSVTSISGNAFYECRSLNNISVDTGNTTYGSLDGVVFDKSQNRLIRCPQGKSGHYTVPEGVTWIADSAFLGCGLLSGITIPDSIAALGNYAFRFSSNLQSVYFMGNPPAAAYGIFEGANNVTVYYLPGTTGWESTYAQRPTALWCPLIGEAKYGDGTSSFVFNGSWATGMTVVVEACTNIATGAWVPLYTSTLTEASFSFADPNATNYACRFYRIAGP